MGLLWILFAIYSTNPSIIQGILQSSRGRVNKRQGQWGDFGFRQRSGSRPPGPVENPLASAYSPVNGPSTFRETFQQQSSR